MGPSGNWQGSQVCFELETGRVILCRVIKVLPMPDSVIKIINDWGKSQKNADFKSKLDSGIGSNRNTHGRMMISMWTMEKLRRN